MLEQRTAWETISALAPRDAWIPVHDIYALIEAHVVLDDLDQLPEPEGSSATWQLTVRQTLQAARLRAEVEFAPRRGIRVVMPNTSPTALAERERTSTLAAIDSNEQSHVLSQYG